ncbi:MAG: TetR/AcrR family transcriptional regulator [Oscillospiraceae bacterium]|nr:TetR/AcrR family transcriptional regulator [Oscillospiraceae bacterium]
MSEKTKRDIEVTKKALLDAAEKLMTKCSDPAEVTSRAIAKESGANLAMINYCFGSRERLLYEVFQKLLTDVQMKDKKFLEIMSSGLPPKRKLAELHYKMMKIMLENYNYAQAVTKYILLNRSEDFGMESLPFIEEHYKGKKSTEECRMVAFELTSLHELAVLRYEELKKSCGMDLTDDKMLKKYVFRNINRFLD